MQEYDLVVIGSGSGLDVAGIAAHQGLKVAIIEKGGLGGTCLNSGCIPSKMLIHCADIVQIIKKAGIFGIDVDYNIKFSKLVGRVNKIINSDSNRIKNALQKTDNPKLIPYRCKFFKDNVISVHGQLIKGEKILIACGTRPDVPKIKGIENCNYMTSNEALRLRKKPKVMTIIGGGYIAAELGHFFGSLGTKINIIHRGDKLLSKEDKDISEKFTDISSKRFNVYLRHYAHSISQKGTKFQVLAFDSKENIIQFDSDQVLVATGRVPNTDLLGVDKTNIKVDTRGYVIVDRYLETNVEGVFALGDVIGRYQFKHSANLEAEYAYNNIIHPDKKIPVDYFAMPHAIFCFPQIAGVGYTEQQAKEMGLRHYCSIYRFIDTAMGHAMLDREGFVKFVISDGGKILGCHIIGSHASILIHEVLVCLRAGDGTINSIKRTIHIHPALSEVILRAAAAAAK
jgi:dihydrolipoamide dehydrogenase